MSTAAVSAADSKSFHSAIDHLIMALHSISLAYSPFRQPTRHFASLLTRWHGRGSII